MKKITSLNHSLIKHFVSLRKNHKYRTKKNACLIIGNKIVKDVAKKHTIQTLITTQDPPILNNEKKSIILVTRKIMKKITDLPSPETTAAEVLLPKPQEIKNQKFILVLDKIKDPGNLGTLIRTAHGLNWDGIIITPKTVDPYNDKALRSAKGSTFFIPIFRKTQKEILKLIEVKNYMPLVADIEGKKVEKYPINKKIMLILGSESFGIDKWAKNLNNKITISMAEDIDSLNVAISGGILMYLIRRDYGKKINR